METSRDASAVPGPAMSAWTISVALALGVGLARGAEPLTGPWTIVTLVGAMIAVAAALASGVGAGRSELVPVSIASVVVLVGATRGILAAIGYPGLESLSSADIQYLRTAEYLEGGGSLGAPEARLALYPTSFEMLVALSAASGLAASTILEWSWLLSLPIMAMGTFLFARELTGSPLAGGLATVVAASNPWFYAEPVYDGFSLVLLPLWSYLMVRQRREIRRSLLTFGSLLLLTAIISSHFFSALFLVLAGFAVGASTGYVDDTSRPLLTRLTTALRSGTEASVLPVVAVTAWLTYIAARYLQEGIGLVEGFITALTSSPFSPETTGTTRLEPWQLAILLIAFAAYAGFGLAALWNSIRTKRRPLVASIVLAVCAGPLIVWALVTPMTFGGGTDLKEWKVRPLHGAFLLVAPAIGLGILEVRRRWSGVAGAAIVSIAVAAMLTNSVSLWLFYGSPGDRVLSADAIPRVVEDRTVTPGEYQALGEYVRRSIAKDQYLIADWHQVEWITGAGGLRQVPDYLSAPFTSREALARVLTGTYDGIAVDRNLARLPSLYTDSVGNVVVMDSLDGSSLDKVFDSGSQVLYVASDPDS